MEKETKDYFGPKTFEGISQYRPPLNFELAGKQFELVMDDGYEYILDFTGRKMLKYGVKGSDMVEYTYDCLKADDDTYFVNFEVTGAVPRAGITFILDMEQSLVTENYITVGQNPRYPRLPKTNIIFGAIRKEDGTIPRIRHGFTDELVGHSVCWRYGTMAAVHVYSSERYYRVTVPKDAHFEAPENEEFHNNFRKKMEGRLYEEPADYIKIKDGMYAFSMTEMLQNFLRGQGNNLFFLMNANRMYDVGRSFGHRENGEPENYTMGAYGEVYETPELMARKSTEYIR